MKRAQVQGKTPTGAGALLLPLLWLAGCEPGSVPDSDSSPAPDSQDDDSGNDTGCDDPAVEYDLALADAKLIGEEPHASLGYVAVGDLDADGHGDLLVGGGGVYEGDTSLDVTYVVRGPIMGLETLSLLAAAEAALVADREFGTPSTGDVNGDGFDDVLLGWSPPETGPAIHVTFGPVSGAVDLDASHDAALWGEDLSSQPVVGDFNGDGTGDALVGAGLQDLDGRDSGAAYLVLGPLAGDRTLGGADDATLVGEGAHSWAGNTVTAGDVNGDGLDDAVVGAPRDYDFDGICAVYFVFSPFSGTLSLADADVRMLAEYGGDRAGGSLATGDVDGDGNEDVLVGATAVADNGATYLVYGPGSGKSSLAEADAKFSGNDGEQAGESVAIGDVDADGHGDMLIGTQSGYSGPGPGHAWLMFGPATGAFDLACSDIRLVGEEDDDNAGQHVALGDIDGDGRQDPILGADQNDTGGESAGAVYLVLGQSF